MNRIFLMICIASLAIVGLNGCYYDKEDQLYPNLTGCDSTNVTFSASIQPIISSRCSINGCHVAGAQVPDLSTYTNIVANIARVKVRAMDLKTMPSSGPLSTCEIAKLQKWINAGTPNN